MGPYADAKGDDGDFRKRVQIEAENERFTVDTGN